MNDTQSIKFCGVCDKKIAFAHCHNCGQDLCKRLACSEKCPDYNKKIYILCIDCVNAIEDNLHMLIPKEHDEQSQIIYNAFNPTQSEEVSSTSNDIQDEHEYD